MKNNRSRDFWTMERRALLRDLAASGMPASVIGATIGATKLSVLNCCKRREIDVLAHTEAEFEQSRATAREKNRRKQARWQKKQKMNPATAKASHVRVRLGTSQSSVVYRNQLPRLPDSTTKFDLRRMLSEAARNTAEMETQ